MDDLPFSARYGVFYKGMMWIGVENLVAAVSNAGGLGILTGLTFGTPDKLREAIREVRRRTNKPLLSLLSVYMLMEYGLTIDLCPLNSGVNLTFLPTMNPPPYVELAQVVIDEGIKVVETAGGPAAAPIMWVSCLDSTSILDLTRFNQS